MNADFLKTNLHFKEGIKGAYYKKIDGFLYTVDPNDGTEIFFFVNLPKVDEEEKHIFINFLKENLKSFVRARIVKNGIKITLTPDAFDEKNFIVKTAQQISEYLKSRDIHFTAEKSEIVYKNNYFVDNNGVQHQKETHQGDLLWQTQTILQTKFLKEKI